MRGAQQIQTEAVLIPLDSEAVLQGDLSIPLGASALVIFAHGSGSSRHSPRNRYIAEELQQAELATLLFDLLTHQEEQLDIYTRQYRFDIGLLAERLVAASEWLAQQPTTRQLEPARIACVGAGKNLEEARRPAIFVGSELEGECSGLYRQRTGLENKSGCTGHQLPAGCP